MIYAAIGTVCVLGALTYLELNNREITWKEFINKYVFSLFFKFIQSLILSFFLYSYLAKGMVEKLEVVNKKWVRVRLPAGSNTSDGVTLTCYIIFT